MYFYFELDTTWHRGLVVSVSDFGTKDQGQFLSGHLLSIVLFFFFSQSLGLRFGTSKMHLSPPGGLGYSPF